MGMGIIWLVLMTVACLDPASHCRLSPSTCFSTCSGSSIRRNPAHIYRRSMNFSPEVRQISENGPLTVVLWEQEVPGSNPGAPTDVTS